MNFGICGWPILNAALQIKKMALQFARFFVGVILTLHKILAGRNGAEQQLAMAAIASWIESKMCCIR
jgi:hypothetical protein